MLRKALPHELIQIVAGYLHNPKSLLHKELSNLAYTFIRIHYLGRMRVYIDDFGTVVSVPFYPNPVFENLPARMCWPPLNFWERRENRLVHRQFR